MTIAQHNLISLNFTLKKCLKWYVLSYIYFATSKRIYLNLPQSELHVVIRGKLLSLDGEGGDKYKNAESR